MTTPDFKTDIPILGKAKIISPLKRHIKKDEPGKRFVSDEERIIVDVQMDRLKTDVKQNSSFDQAGPREKKHFDPSGNIVLQDIGRFLKEKILQWFKTKQIPVSLKYIDPSYIIRSLPANANDSVFCGFLGREAVHAGMAGKTNLLISFWNDHYVHVPMDACAGKRKIIDPGARLWQSVLEATGQDTCFTR